MTETYRPEIEDAYPLSPMQQGMLFDSLYDTKSGVGIEQMVCELREPVSLPALRRAWERVVERHAILRTAFRWHDLEAPRQEVAARVTVPFEHIYAQGFNLEAFLKADRRRGFDLARAPLMRVSLLERGERDYVMVWTFHHALLDGRSRPSLLREVFAFHEAFARGEDISLPLPRPYREYIEWLGRRDPSKAEAFFRESLHGFRVPTPLPGSHEAAYPSGDVDYVAREIRLPAAATAALYALANQHELTMNTLVQGAFALLTHHYTGETTVVFGVTRACRRSALDGEGAEGMVGIFINTLPLRVEVSPEAQVIPWLSDLRARWSALRDHEHTPLVEIREYSQVPKSVPLFETLSVFENFMLDDALRAEGKAWENRRFRVRRRTSFPLALVGYGGNALTLRFEYDPRRFEDKTIGRMLAHLDILLRGMAEDPSRRVADLLQLTPEERRTLLVDWNQTAVDFPRTQCIHHLVEAQVERTPDAAALSCQGERITYRELDRRSNQVARALVKRGVGPDVLVGVCCRRSIDTVVGLLGVLKAGGAYVPIDPVYPRARIASIVDDARAPVLLTEEAVLDVLPSIFASTRIVLDRDREALSQESFARLDGEVAPSNLAYVIYTSGSTGRPKGVAVEHHSVVALISWAREVFSDDELRGVLFSTSVCFDMSVFELFVTLSLGGMLIIADSALDLPRLPEANLVTLINTVPTAMAELVQARTIPRSVRTVNLGGEPLQNSLAQQVYAVKTVERVYNLYGPTEDTVYSTFALVRRGASAHVPIGKVMSNSQAYVLDAKMNPSPIGVTGELFLGGEGLARGYLNRPDLTADKFLPNPFRADPSARLYRTGDLARFREDGELECLGRVDHQVKLRGFRIELGEIEAVLSEHPGVHECAAMVREDTPGHKLLVAYFSFKGDAPSAAELRETCSQRLPDFMIPSAFVALDRLPQTLSGKIDKQALPPPDADAVVARGFAAPHGQIEEALAHLFADVLKCDVESIGRSDSFFDRGGHSLLAARLADRIERTFGHWLNLAAVIGAPTVEALARLIREKKGGSALLAINPPNGERTPLFWCGQSMKEVTLLARHLGPDQPFYSLESSFYNVRSPETHIKDYAARYLEEVQRAQPRGPYFLGGFCLDALIAVEMAERLQDRGQEVALLAMVDRCGPDALYGKIRSVVRWVVYHERELARRAASERTAYVVERIGQKWRQFLSTLNGGASPEEAASAQEVSEAEYDMYLSRKAREAVRHYKIERPYSGRTVLFFAEDTIRYVPPSIFPRAGWEKSSTGPATVEVVPGDHDHIIVDPGAGILAKRLRGHLDLAQEEIQAKLEAPPMPTLRSLQCEVAHL